MESLAQTVEVLTSQKALLEDQLVTTFAQMTLLDLDLATRRKADAHLLRNGYSYTICRPLVTNVPISINMLEQPALE